MHDGTNGIDSGGGPAARQAVGVMSNMRVNDVVNEPTLDSPTDQHTSATGQSVPRSSEAARSRRRVSR